MTPPRSRRLPAVLMAKLGSRQSWHRRPCRRTRASFPNGACKLSFHKVGRAGTGGIGPRQLQPFSCPNRAPATLCAQVPPWPLQSLGGSVGCLDSAGSWGFPTALIPTLAVHLLAGRFGEIVSFSRASFFYLQNGHNNGTHP